VETPYFYRDHSFRAVLDHEIGTHHIRSLNQNNLDPKLQTHLKKVKRGWMLSAEEGLASISVHMHYTKCDLFFNPALNYFAACTAMENDFWNTFKTLFKYTTGFDECWIKTLRVKRGISDTSKPGAFCKDQCSLDGMLRILEARERINFPALFAGKVSLETYFDSEDLLLQASHASSYVMPPHLRGKDKYEFFLRRCDDMYRNHQELFMRTRSISNYQFCNGLVKPPISFNGEGISSKFRRKVAEIADSNVSLVIMIGLGNQINSNSFFEELIGSKQVPVCIIDDSPLTLDHA
jgi:hypothetical protein